MSDTVIILQDECIIAATGKKGVSRKSEMLSGFR